MAKVYGVTPSLARRVPGEAENASCAPILMGALSVVALAICCVLGGLPRRGCCRFPLRHSLPLETAHTTVSQRR
ncbi:hypothetical protein KCP70_05430 [Salmonella enterica subsp. enterica]|nr:hypothetical protein KCP70_05430 [Salmonella enterica subsp. enterica]